jgi:hypothetical protein
MLLPVAGVLAWMDVMAAQLAPQVEQPGDGTGHMRVVAYIVRLWDHLARTWDARAASVQSALTLLQPGVLSLIQQLALHPPLTAAVAAGSDIRPSLVDACLQNVTRICGAALSWQQPPGLRGATALGTLSSSLLGLSRAGHSQQQAVLANEVRPGCG